MMSIYGKESPLNIAMLRIITLYCILVLILSLIFNSTLLAVLNRHRCLRTNLNLLIRTLTILNLFGSIIKFSFLIPSNFQGR